MTTTRLSIVRLRAWLNSLPPTTIVGQPRDAWACPLATYLNTANTGRAAQVGANGYTLWNRTDDLATGPDYALPSWAGAFMTRADQLLDPITAHSALALLDQALDKRPLGLRTEHTP